MQNTHGKGWTARQVDTTFILSIADGASLIESMTDFILSERITAGQITGIGAVNEVVLRFFDPHTKQYVDREFHEQMEIANLSGNISLVGGMPILHLHATLGRSDYTALAGHVLDAKIRWAGEFFITPLDTRVVKVKDTDIGLNLYNFAE